MATRKFLTTAMVYGSHAILPHTQRNKQTLTVCQGNAVQNRPSSGPQMGENSIHYAHQAALDGWGGGGSCSSDSGGGGGGGFT